MPADAARRSNGRSSNGRGFWVRLAVFALVLFGLNDWIASRATQQPTRVRIPYSPTFLQQVQTGNVATITTKGTAVQGEFKRTIRYQKHSTRRFGTEIPSFANTNALSKLLQEKGVVINAQPLQTGTPWWQSLLFGFGPTLLFLVLLFWLMRRAAGGAGGMLNAFGRSRARRYEPTGARVTFADVAGIDEAEGGARTRSSTSSGSRRSTGAWAARCRRACCSIGAARHRQDAAGARRRRRGQRAVLQHRRLRVRRDDRRRRRRARARPVRPGASAAAPAIIFIDELDAIGRARGAGMRVGGNDEREQTLNQILTEMDGFDAREGVIVLAATNRPDVLDPALLRPGRFDRRVTVQPPDRRAARPSCRSTPAACRSRRTSTWTGSRRQTPGLVGADLRNLVNEAALLAARRERRTRSTRRDFADALEKIVLGAERKIMPHRRGPRARRLPRGRPRDRSGCCSRARIRSSEVTIMPRGQALGVTFSGPRTTATTTARTTCARGSPVALGGRAAEELVYGERTTGAENDLQQADRHRAADGHALGDERRGRADRRRCRRTGGRPSCPARTASAERTQELVDQEVRRIVDEARERLPRAAEREPRPARRAGEGAAREGDARRGRGVRGRGREGAGCGGCSGPRVRFRRGHDRRPRDRLGDRDRAGLHGGRRRRRRRSSCPASSRSRAGRTRHVPRPAVDDPPVRGLRLRRGDERSASATCSSAARPGSRSPSTCRRSSATTRTIRARSARSAAPASRSTRSRTWSCSSTGSRSTRSRRR